LATFGVASLVAVLSACGSSTPSKSSVHTPSGPGSTTTERSFDPSIDGTEIDQLPTTPSPTTPPSKPDLSTVAGQTAFLQQVFTDIQSVWNTEFTTAGQTYSPARLVLFQSRVATACGTESASVGPFYCPGDATVYLDISFFKSMESQFGAVGDFAEAYVVAHEMGHHIQNLVGITNRVAAAEQATPSIGNPISVRVELQADCLAGVWAHSAYQRDLLEPGDIEEALKAAQVVGDDYLAQATGAAVDPDSWTHGSSAQRQQWLTTGYEKGTPDDCDTFAGS
jgi:predicted metalloprotease